MEIAVATSSPLGQYLAELEANGDNSMAHLQSVHRPTGAQKCSRRRTGNVARYWTWKQWSQSFQYRVELIAIQRLLPKLCTFHSTIREELQQATRNATVIAASLEIRKNWWVRHVAVFEVLSGVEVVTDKLWESSTSVAGVFVVVLAIMAAFCFGTNVTIVQLMQWIMTAIVIVLLGNEISVRLLLGLYARRSRRLVSSINEFWHALKNLNEIYAESLAIVERAELASQGYQLGAGMLPPISRVEAIIADDCVFDEDAAMSVVKTQLRCVPLRRKLRELNDQLLRRASAFLQEDEMATENGSQDAFQKKYTTDDRAPSLLLTALAKQHYRGILLLKKAVRTVLVRALAGACSSKHSSLFHNLSSQRGAIEKLIKVLQIWACDLEAWNTTKDPVALCTSNIELEASKLQNHHQNNLSSITDPGLKSVAMQLRGIRSMSETLTALSIAVQYELLSSESGLQALCNSQNSMRSLALQLQEEWNKFDEALNALRRGENPQDTDVEKELTRKVHCESQTITVAAPSSIPPSGDSPRTVVFTGTSTGDDSFDIRSILKQHEVDTTAASSAQTLHFVRELRDVLAHRVAHARPGFTKLVDHDFSTFSPLLEPNTATFSLARSSMAKADFSLPPAPPCKRPCWPSAFTLESVNDDEPMRTVSQVSQNDT